MDTYPGFDACYTGSAMRTAASYCEQTGFWAQDVQSSQLVVSLGILAVYNLNHKPTEKDWPNICRCGTEEEKGK